MRIVVVVVVLVLAGCTAPDPDQTMQTPPPVGTQPPSPDGLAAAEPFVPSLSEFRRQAARACAVAVAELRRAPLRGDPLREGARQPAVGAAIQHYQTAFTAWNRAAGQLWEFGLPRQTIAERLITTLDTIAQHSRQTAEYLQAGDRQRAEAALGATEQSRRQGNRLSQRLGIGRLEDCGRKQRQLPNARRVRVVATDFAFQVDEVTRGATRFVLHNAGDEDHQLFVVRLREPGLLDGAVRADRTGERPGPYLRGRGAASRVVPPGGRSFVDVRLQPGAYGLLCFVASPDGTPHAYKGMATEIFVDR